MAPSSAPVLLCWKQPSGCVQILASQRERSSQGLVSVGQQEGQLLSWGHIQGSWSAVAPGGLPEGLTRLGPRVARALQCGWPGGTCAFGGPLGPPFSNKRWVQRAVGSRPLRAGVCVCVCVCACLSLCLPCVCLCVFCVCCKTCLPPKRSAPLGSFLSRKWDARVAPAHPSCPCGRGLDGGGFLLQEERGWLCVQEGCTSTLSGSRVGVGWALEAGAEVGGPSNPSVTGQDGPEVPSE